MNVTNMPLLKNDQLSGVDIFCLGRQVRRGEPQEVLVRAQPKATIPRHTHSVDAEMFIVAGDATIISDDPDLNGRHVGVGECVFFEREVAHGFQVGEHGLSFVSRNGGIVDESGVWDMQMV